MTRWPLPSIPVRPARRTRPPTPVEAAILDALRTRGELATSQVALAVGRTEGRVSFVLHRLANAGVVVSRRAADNKRQGVTWTMWRIK